jgi:hypothetical protein
MGSSEQRREALVHLSDALVEHGITARGVRDLPEGPALMVLVNLIITHDGVHFQWREGRNDRAHPGDDAQGAAEVIAPLVRRLHGPAFNAESEQVRDTAP